jgi:hypothetical protein
MAAFTGTPTGSTQYNSTPMQYTNYVKAVFSYTHAAGAGTGEVNLLKLPPGKVVIYSADSRIACSAMATGADIHLGFRAYVEPDGDVVAESNNAFLNDGDAATGLTSAAWTLPAAGFTEFNVRYSTGAAYKGMGLILFAMIDTGNIEDTDTISGYCAYATS